LKSIVQVDIDLPHARLASLFADPTLSTKWMDDIARYEPISGQPGAPGSTYRLVPRNGDMIFVVTVIANDLPNESRLRLDADNVTVAITARYLAVSSERSRLVSEEDFTFKGMVGRIGGFLARAAIHRAHRRQMESFKRFAEG
jgi:hypothetical protein